MISDPQLIINTLAAVALMAIRQITIGTELLMQLLLQATAWSGADGKKCTEVKEASPILRSLGTGLIFHTPWLP